jgi:hypothetical protein
MSLEKFIGQRREYIEAKIKHLDSDIRMRTMSEFERAAQLELKEFLQELINRTPTAYLVPPYFG